MKTMNIARRNAGMGRNGVIQSGTNNSTGNGFRSFRIKMRENMAKCTYKKVGRRADVGNELFEIEMAVKSDAEELDMVCQRNRCTGNHDGS